jgi:aryl-alcohol dehydrogenase-like predicted oxidoreductase
MQTRTLGRTGPAVSALGLGAMGMSGAYGAADRAESIATVHAALEGGVTLFDTGDFYAMGHNELLLAEALRGRDRDSYQLSVKFGMLRGPGAEFGGQDGRPGAVKNFLAYSLTRLGTDHVDIYRPARLDPAVPIEETVGAIKEMIDAGHVPLVGARTRERLAEALPAMELNLTPDDLAEIEKAVPPGAARRDRYPSAFMSDLGVGN